MIKKSIYYKTEFNGFIWPQKIIMVSFVILTLFSYLIIFHKFKMWGETEYDYTLKTFLLFSLEHKPILSRLKLFP